MTYQEKLFISQPEEYKNAVFQAIAALSTLRDIKYIKKVKIAVEEDGEQFGYDLEMAANAIMGESTAAAFASNKDEAIEKDSSEDACNCDLCSQTGQHNETYDSSESHGSEEEDEDVLDDLLFKIKVASSFISLQSKIQNLEGNMKIIAEELAALKGK